MPRAARLKVFRTPIGFHDAYVAAPSQKAALAAWGADRNLFAQGAAELVTDPALTKEPLARPGEVIRRLRGSEAEQLAALGSAPPKRSRAKAAKPNKSKSPRPSRAELDEAEAAFAALEHEHQEQRRLLAREEAALAARRRELETSQRRERAEAERRRDRASDSYQRALERWAG